jgi:hypothetical protein
VIKARTITQHGPLPWKMEFNNIQIFGFRYVNYIVFYFIRTISTRKKIHGAYDPGYRSEYFSNTNGEGYIPFAKDQKMDGSYLCDKSQNLHPTHLDTMEY